MRGGLFLRVTRSHTGRSADIDHDYRLAQEWASRSGRELADHPHASSLSQRLASPLYSKVMRFSCFVPGSMRQIFSLGRIWGLPNLTTCRQRLIIVLVRSSFTSAIQNLACCWRSRVVEPCVYFVQEFLLTPASLRLADLASTANVNIVHSVLEFAEVVCRPWSDRSRDL